MKFRSGLLVACMIVVPMLAMFSHHVPDGLIPAASRLVYDPLVARFFTPLNSKAAGGNAIAAAASPTQPEAATGPVSMPTAVPPAAVTSLPAGPAVARLAALGALAIDCQPMPGIEGSHRASCRIPVDAAGQLHRVFQATGPDRTAAEQNLLDNVLATRRHPPR